MTVREFAAHNGFQVLAGSEEALEQPVTGVYACDLLSWAMAKVKKGDVWTTVHTNLNVVAVASLTEAACVVIPEGIEVEPQTLERANRQDVVILSAKESAAEIILLAHEGITHGNG